MPASNFSIRPGTNVQALVLKRLVIISKNDRGKWINERCPVLIEASLDKVA